MNKLPEKIKGLLIVALIIAATSANAQFKFGVGGGVNMSNMGGSDISGTDRMLGFNGGFMMEVKLPIKLGFEADVLFSTKGTKGLLFKDENGNSIGTTDLKFSYIDMPVVIKIYMAKVLSFQLGAQYSVLLNSNSLGVYSDEKWKNSDLSAVVGFGLDVLKLHVSARYNYGLTSIDAAGADVKSNMVTLTLGVWLK